MKASTGYLLKDLKKATFTIAMVRGKADEKNVFEMLWKTMGAEGLLYIRN
jgi:hypothetical protein